MIHELEITYLEMSDLDLIEILPGTCLEGLRKTVFQPKL
jgi:hypothetical protein